MSGPPHIVLALLVGLPFLLIFSLVHTLHIPIDNPAGGAAPASLAIIMPTLVYGPLGALLGLAIQGISAKKSGKGPD